MTSPAAEAIPDQPGTLVVDGPRSPTHVLGVVVAAIACHADTTAAAIEVDKPLSAVPGIESVKALRAITEIEDDLDVVIPDDFLFETATVRELAGFVAGLLP